MEVFRSMSKQWRILCNVRGSRFLSDDRHTEPPIPDYDRQPEKSLEVRKARLQYQSRKRGMLENDLILSTFANRFLKGMDLEMVEQYDRLINLPTNDWDIYYWATGVKPVPEEFDNKVMQLLKEHVTNTNREMRIRQPELQQLG